MIGAYFKKKASKYAALKSGSIKLVITVIAITVLSFFIDTVSSVPPENALVYLNPAKTVYFPPTRTPANSNFIPVPYSYAKHIGAKPDDPQGFNVDGPPLLITILESAGIISDWPTYWSGTNTLVKKIK